MLDLILSRRVTEQKFLQYRRRLRIMMLVVISQSERVLIIGKSSKLVLDGIQEADQWLRALHGQQHAYKPEGVFGGIRVELHGFLKALPGFLKPPLLQIKFSQSAIGVRLVRI